MYNYVKKKSFKVIVHFYLCSILPYYTLIHTPVSLYSHCLCPLHMAFTFCIIMCSVYVTDGLCVVPAFSGIVLKLLKQVAVYMENL